MNILKRDIVISQLGRGSIYVVVDIQQPGVVLPRHFEKDAQVVLQFGYNLSIPIRDLRVMKRRTFVYLRPSRRLRVLTFSIRRSDGG